MKFFRSIALASLALLSPALAAEAEKYTLQEGDIVFTSSERGQGRAIMDATGSRYTHCGIVLIQNGKPSVRQAIIEKYGSLEKLPKNEKVVAPSDLALSSSLVEVPKAP